METTSSQSDVPNPTTIKPIKNSETFIFFPIEIAQEINMSDPFTSNKSPMMSVAKLKSIFSTFFQIVH